MYEFYVGMQISDNGTIRDHSRRYMDHTGVLEWCKRVTSAKPDTKTFILKAIEEVVRKESPVEIILLSTRDELDDTEKLKEDFPMEPKSLSTPMPAYELDV